MRTAILTLAVLIGGVLALDWATAGFTALTSERARQLAVARQPVALPPAVLTTAEGKAQPLEEWLAEQDKATLVSFVYTRCNSICLALGNEFQQMQRQLIEEGLEDRVRLLSISFDPAYDTPERLSRYAERMRADPAVWQFATVRDAQELEQLLDAFGIVIVEDEFGGFEHNAAFHVVAPSNALTAIVDFTKPRRALATALGEREA